MFNDVCIVSVRQSRIVYQAPHKVVCQHGDWMATSLPQGFVWVCTALNAHFLSPSRVAFSNSSTVNAAFV